VQLKGDIFNVQEKVLAAWRSLVGKQAEFGCRAKRDFTV
jgi:hypothetical protein